ncbi:Nuclear pore complex protein NUP93A [Frankliniella fusca]|uniref:Nuclear pore complex protein NUP93A n=1 Tax=Frankliniella fusca TaxID=407009 RepID=A0AAE1HE88_9NEOP|nr:Nuclear pore complex protein NUP93A [Frankliniella fusca]
MGSPVHIVSAKLRQNFFIYLELTTNIFQGARAVAAGERITQRAVDTLTEWIQCLARMTSDGGSGAVRSPPASKLFCDLPHTRLK